MEKLSKKESFEIIKKYTSIKNSSFNFIKNGYIFVLDCSSVFIVTRNKIGDVNIIYIKPKGLEDIQELPFEFNYSNKDNVSLKVINQNNQEND